MEKKIIGLEYLNLIKERMEVVEKNIMINAYKELELLNIEKERIEFKAIMFRAERDLKKIKTEKNVIENLILVLTEEKGEGE